MPLAAMLKSAVLFVAAGLCEIGGGYLVWQWLRNGRGLAMGAVGGVVLFLYGVIPTLQPQRFSRVYAAYGGVFVALSLAWGWDPGWTETRPLRSVGRTPLPPGCRRNHVLAPGLAVGCGAA